MVTASASPFNPTPVTLSGTQCEDTVLNIPTVPRPVNTGSLLRRFPLYAAWLPIGGLSLVGLGIGAGRRRCRWLMGAVLGLIAGIILLSQAAESPPTAPPRPEERWREPTPSRLPALREL